MSEFVVVIVLAIIAGTIAGVELIRTRGQELLAWAVLFVALAIVIDRL